MQIAGVAWGYQIFSKPKLIVQHYVQDAKELTKWVILMWANLYLSKNILLCPPPSRRLANWTYLNWMVAYNLTLTLLFVLSDILLRFCEHLKQRQLNTQSGSLEIDNSHSSANTGSNMQGRRKGRSKKENQSEAVNRPQPMTKAENMQDNWGINNLREIDHRKFSIHVPVIFSAISHNALVYFLLANLLTGLINISIPTIHINGCPAVLIISAYMSVLHCIIVAMYRIDFKLL